MNEPVFLQRSDENVPWGFRLTGGRDSQQPLSVQRVTPGTIADTGLSMGDVILRIADSDASSLSQAQANELIKQSGNNLSLFVRRKDGISRPTACPAPAPTVSQAATGGSQQNFSAMLNQKLAGAQISPNKYSQSKQLQHPQQQHQQQQQPQSPSRNVVGPGGPFSNVDLAQPNEHPRQDPQSPEGPQPSFRRSTSREQPGEATGQYVPDAVINMAARGAPDKKPWAYAPDVSSLREHRDKIRRKPQQEMFKDPRDQQWNDYEQETGGAEIDTTSIRPRNDDEGVGDYSEASIRYLGKNIPSKSFRMLQTMTGAENDGGLQPPGRHRMQKKPQAAPEEPAQNPDDVVDIRFVGGNIPSKSFKFLQHSIGDPGADAQTQDAGHVSAGGTRQNPSVKVTRMRQEQRLHNDRVSDF